MNYKVGDTVKLKSKEELEKLGTWLPWSAEERGGKSYKITAKTNGRYLSGDLIFDENSIECLESKGDNYTFENLKKNVIILKEYLVQYENNTGQHVKVKLNSNLLYEDVKITIEIND